MYGLACIRFNVDKNTVSREMDNHKKVNAFRNLRLTSSDYYDRVAFIRPKNWQSWIELYYRGWRPHKTLFGKVMRKNYGYYSEI